MSYHTVLASDGTLPLPEELIQAIGIRPGDGLSVVRSGSSIVVRREDGRDAAIARLRGALRDYSVDQFLRERRSDAGE